MKKAPNSKFQLPASHRAPVLATLLLALFLFSVSAIETHAHGGPTPGNNIPLPFKSNATEINNACEPQMSIYAAKELEDYRNFLEINFQNKSSTASLLDTALAKYREVRTELTAAYAGYYPHQGSYQLTTGLQSFPCWKIVEDTLEDAKILLRHHALQTSSVKKTTALLEKYKQINNELQAMNQQMNNMKAALDAFAQKLPCYLEKGSCVKK